MIVPSLGHRHALLLTFSLLTDQFKKLSCQTALIYMRIPAKPLHLLGGALTDRG